MKYKLFYNFTNNKTGQASLIYRLYYHYTEYVTCELIGDNRENNINDNCYNCLNPREYENVIEIL